MAAFARAVDGRLHIPGTRRPRHLGRRRGRSSTTTPCDRMFGRAGRIEDLTWADLSSLRADGESLVPRLVDVLDVVARVPSQHRHEGGLGGGSDHRGDLEGRRARPGAARLLQRPPDPVGPTDLRAPPGDLDGPARGRPAADRVPARPPAWRASCPGSPAVQVPVRYRRIRVVDARFVNHAHRLGMQVHVWTIDDPAEMHELLDLGVDGIMTDRIEVLRDVLIARGRWPSDRPSCGTAKGRPDREKVGRMATDVSSTEVVEPAQPSTRRERVGWYFYDWANSAFSTTVIAVFLAPVPDRHRRERRRLRHRRQPVRRRAALPAGHPGRRRVVLRVLPVAVGRAAGPGAADHRRHRRPVGPPAAAARPVRLHRLRRHDRASSSSPATATCSAACCSSSPTSPSARASSSTTRSCRTSPVRTTGTGCPASAGRSATSAAACCSCINLGALIAAGDDNAGLVARWSLVSAGVWWAVFTTLPLAMLKERPAPAGEARGPVLTDGFRQLGQDPARAQGVPAVAVLPDRLPGLQRRHPDRDRDGEPVRRQLPQAERGRPGADDPAGAVHGLRRRAAAGLAGQEVRRLEDGARQPRAVDDRRQHRVLPAGRRGAALHGARPAARHRARRQPGAEPVAVQPAHPEGQGGRVLRLLRDLRQGHELARVRCCSG